MSYWNVFCYDRKDGTSWTMRVYACSADGARVIVLDRIAPHVTIKGVEAA